MSMEQILDDPARIIVDDDDPGIRTVVSDYLADQGYQVETVGDAKELERALARGLHGLAR